ncbi:MAG: hypothetical protein ABIP90_13190, partial [Vicinamibacterales bacterium]
MSDQGFREVQLSGKQLVFLFMSAVVVMVVVFLLGVNVGRGVRDAVGDTEISAQADPSSTEPADEAVASAETAKPAKPELSYHDMLLGSTPPGEKAAAGEKTVPVETPPPVNEAPSPSPTPKKPSPTPAAPPATQPAPAQSPAAAPKSNRSD